MKFTIHILRMHIYMCTNTPTQDSLLGTRQQCTAKWDVWEPPAAKRRTGRRNKPSLMETWHAHWGGNSNKRLMGHGAFSTAAKYPPLLPLSVLPLSSCAPFWPRGSYISRPRPLSQGDIFLPLLTPVVVKSLNTTMDNTMSISWTSQKNLMHHRRVIQWKKDQLLHVYLLLFLHFKVDVKAFSSILQLR